MPSERTSEERRWEKALRSGAFGVWDLNPVMEMVHYSPRWKEHLGFPMVQAADSTAFWRCRVHPEDLQPMMKALRAHLDGFTATYEMRFRLRSNGSGYRTMLSQGRVIERDHRGDPTRMLGTMVDLTDRPATPPPGLLADDPALLAPAGAQVPFHRLLGISPPLCSAGPDAGSELRDRLLGQVDDLLDQALRRAVMGKA
jgi:hypothetical protein